MNTYTYMHTDTQTHMHIHTRGNKHTKTQKRAKEHQQEGQTADILNHTHTSLHTVTMCALHHTAHNLPRDYCRAMYLAPHYQAI